MNAKVIETEVSEDGVIHIQDKELKPGRIQLVILTEEPETKEPSKKAKKSFPFGGHKAGWIKPEDLSRESIYE